MTATKTPTQSAPPEQNHLLGQLPQDLRERITPHLTGVNLSLGDVIYEAGQKLEYVYFPAESIISLLYVMSDGDSGEIAVVGYEGVAGIAAFMGGESTPSRAVVQSAGPAYRLPAGMLRDAFNQYPNIRTVMLRYTQALISQMSQTAVCNRHHTIEQQLCRWLLLSMDRLPNNELNMTQELIANMLGVRREGVTEAAGKLQRQGLIEYTRGHILVRDRPALEAHCCECYETVRREAERLQSFPPPLRPSHG
ncbi:MAG: Crp/Fnr family transcriptional regulator [Halospina sp.]